MERKSGATQTAWGEALPLAPKAATVGRAVISPFHQPELWLMFAHEHFQNLVEDN
jgi:hypothetical protein